MSKLRHGYATLDRDFGTVLGVGDDATSWCPAGDQLFGAVCRKLGQGAGKLGPEQDRRPTLCIQLRELSRIAGKR